MKQNANLLLSKFVSIWRRMQIDEEKFGAAYLIAQFGTNYACGVNEEIAREGLLGLAMNQIELLQY